LVDSENQSVHALIGMSLGFGGLTLSFGEFRHAAGQLIDGLAHQHLGAQHHLEFLLYVLMVIVDISLRGLHHFHVHGQRLVAGCQRFEPFA